LTNWTISTVYEKTFLSDPDAPDGTRWKSGFLNVGNITVDRATVFCGAQHSLDAVTHSRRGRSETRG
jgi:hypothetical protein